MTLRPSQPCFLLCGHQQANLKDSRQGESRLGSEAEGLWVVQRNRSTMPLLYALVASTSSPPTILAEHAGKKGNYTDYTTRILGELAGCRGVVFSWSCAADSKLTPLAVIIMSLYTFAEKVSEATDGKATYTTDDYTFNYLR